MMQRLHHWLIPSKRNNYHPKSLRPIGLSIVVLVLAFIPTLYNLSTTRSMQVLGYATNITIGDLNSISNGERTSRGLKALKLNSKLNQAAANKAAHMFSKNYWAHNAPDGTTPWSFMTAAGYSYTTAGENLAKNFATSSGVVNGWMNSPGHKANVLNKSFIDVGYAVMNGTLQGQQTTLVVAMYGATYTAPAPKPAPAPTPAAEPAPAPTPAPSTTTPKTETKVETETKPVEEEKKEETKAPEETAKPVEVTPEAVTSPQTATDTKEDTEQSPAEVAGAIVTAPVEAYKGLNWGQKASIFIMCALALLFIMKHTLIWRSQRKGLRHIWLRAHPLAQASFLIVASIITLLSGTGAVL